jgi:hypothetical protein
MISTISAAFLAMYAPAAPQKNDHVNNSGVCIKRCTTMFSDDKKINRSGQGHF